MEQLMRIFGILIRLLKSFFRLVMLFVAVRIIAIVYTEMKIAEKRALNSIII